MSENISGYHFIADDLKRSIENGTPAPGDRFPTEAALCQQYGASRQTVRRALAMLQEERLICTRRGSGSVVLAADAEPSGESVSHATAIHVITPVMDSYIFPNQINGMESVFLQHNATIHLGVTYNKLNNEAKILNSILNLHPDGVIAEPASSGLPPINAPLYQTLVDSDIPVLFVNSGIPGLSIPYVALDDRKGGYIATRHLIDLGHRKIAMLSKLDTRAGHLRYAGYAEALRAADIPIEESRCVWYTYGSMNDWLSPVLVEYLINKIRDCSAVFCYNDQIACALIEILRQHGISVPDDISVVGYDDSVYSRQSVPPCTTILHPSHRLGATAASLMLDMIHGGKTVQSCLFEPELISRESVCRCTPEKGEAGAANADPA